ncbi:MAG: hypothetical protein MZV65_29585 [Chromatiales bacterium]|nr:hypothetical protein [Chromatiales bacterium]
MLAHVRPPLPVPARSRSGQPTRSARNASVQADGDGLGDENDEFARGA